MKYNRWYPCRCRKCSRRTSIRGRITLGGVAMPAEDDLPQCWHCGACSWRVDKFRRNREHRKYACDCRGVEGCYDFGGAPHRRGSRWCHHNPKFPPDHEVAERFPHLFEVAACTS